MKFEKLRNLVRGDFGFLDVHATTIAIEEDVTGNAGVDGEVLAEVDVLTGVPLGATLADDDVARDDDFTTELFHAEALGAGVATVLDGALSFFMGHGIRRLGGYLCDRVDFDRGECAAIAFGFVEALTTLELEGDAFLAAVVVEHGCLDACAVYDGCANLDVSAFADDERCELEHGALIEVEILDIEFVALLDAVLFTAGFDHCVGHGR